MECIFCHGQMNFQSRRRKLKSAETEEEQFACPVCLHYVAIKEGLRTWYDKNDKPVHGTHDR